MNVNTNMIPVTSIGGVTVGRLIDDGAAQWIIVDTRDMTPIGRVVADITLRPGYVKANGAEVLRADYPRLVQFADDYDLWVAESDKAAYPGLYGQGDGELTFTLPDMRGVVGRYLDEGRGLDDANRLLGTYQGDMFKSHNHQSWVVQNNNDGGGWAPLRLGKVDEGGYFSTSYSRIDPTGGAETRPKNIAVLAVIRY